jgi:hypothetical protein
LNFGSLEINADLGINADLEINGERKKAEN